MTTDIFIRTYHKDIEWLSHSLKSIHKFCSGYRNIIICIPTGQQHLLKHLTQEKVVTCFSYSNDYIGQQVSKLLAYEHSDADYIWFTDSDCIYTMETKPEDFFKDGKPFVLKTPYEKVGDAICWKQPTENAMKMTLTHEYMRRLPLIYRNDTLKKIDLFFNGVEGYVLKQPHFSEFNLMGAFAERFDKNKYVFLDTDTNEIPVQRIKQYWSHSGVTPEFKKEIESILL